MASMINMRWAYFLRVRWLFWLSTFGLALWLVGQLSTQSLQAHWLVNFAAIQATKGLFAAGGPAENQLEVARQTFYQAMDTGYDPYAVLQRLREMESSRWYLQSQILKQQGQDWERVFTYQEWTRGQFDRTILDLWKSSNPPNWSGLGKAAERMQLWSLAAYFYQRILEIEPSKNAQAPFGLGQALFRSGRATEAEQYLMDSLREDSPEQAQTQWLLAQSVAAQGQWSEAARLIEKVAQHAPLLLHTAEAATVARQVEAHNALAISPDLRAAWAREESNLLTNGGFENGYMGWGMWPEPGSNSTIDDQRAYNGLQSFRVQFDGTRDVNYYQVSQSVAVQPSRSYRVSAWLWSEQMTGQLSIEARSGDWFGGVADPVMQGSTNGWQRAVLEFRVPSDISRISVTIVRYGGNGLVSGTIWVDNIVLEPSP